MTSLERFRKQLDSLTRRDPVTPMKPLTGIEKEHQEAEETRRFWQALGDER